MGAAEVGLEILKMFPYAAVAGVAGTAALLAYRRTRPVGDAAPCGALGLGEAEALHPMSPDRSDGARDRVGERGRTVLPRLAAVSRWPRAGWLFLAGRLAWQRRSVRQRLLVLAAGVGLLLLPVVAGLVLWGGQRGAAVVPQAHAAVRPGGHGEQGIASSALVAAEAGMKFGSLASSIPTHSAEGNEPADVAWLFGALISGGRSADAWALLTPQAQRSTSRDNFAALLGSAYLLRGSDDAPWRIPGSNTFLFSVSERARPASLQGELRVGLELVEGQWRVAGFKLRGSEPRVAARPS